MKIGGTNANFGTGQAADQHIVDMFIGLSCAFISLVECKVDNVRAMVPRGYRVLQVMRDAGTRGCAVILAPSVVLRFWALRLGVTPGRARMNTRWLLITNILIDNVPTRLLTFHDAPRRYAWLQPLFWAHVRFRLALSPRRGVWVAMGDSNANMFHVSAIIGGARVYVCNGDPIIGAIAGPGMRLDNFETITTASDNGWTDHLAWTADAHNVNTPPAH